MNHKNKNSSNTGVRQNLKILDNNSVFTLFGETIPYEANPVSLGVTFDQL